MRFLRFLWSMIYRPPRPDDRADAEDDNGNEFLPEYIEVADVLDLHGFYPEQIKRMVPDFLDHAVSSGFQEVKIIHGKGRGKMKTAVLRILTKHPLVASFRDAPPYSSGWGATMVLLKGPRDLP